MMSIRIARFVDLAACRSIFSDESTFVLRSEVYYRKQCEEDEGDKKELIRESPGHSAEFSGALLSCWTKLEGNEPTEDEWRIFDHRVVALISTPEKVCSFLERAFEFGEAGQEGTRRFPFVKSVCNFLKTLFRFGDKDTRRFPVMLLEHGAVRYDEAEFETTAANFIDEVVFHKRPKFGDQKEYRFALPFSGGLPHRIETYIFSRDPFEYLETCYANPAMCEEQRHDLQQILLNAFGGDGHFRDKGDIFANLDFVLQRA